ncbi:MAG TPA: hypothetical protein VGX03_06250 [Candidatus Binatia bacterium]|jgi:hypothetical protein|nr:hypothetical protein [Candidatus Binatia bacterium]
MEWIEERRLAWEADGKPTPWIEWLTQQELAWAVNELPNRELIWTMRLAEHEQNEQSPILNGSARSEPMVADSLDETLEALIDETLADTFPASDPPFWTLGREPHREFTKGNTRAKRIGNRSSTRFPATSESKLEH